MQSCYHQSYCLNSVTDSHKLHAELAQKVNLVDASGRIHIDDFLDKNVLSVEEM